MDRKRGSREAKGPGMNPALRLVADESPRDVIEMLAQLLADADEGQIYGIAFVAIYKGRRVIVDAAGECKRSPIYSRGLVAVLDDFFRDKIPEYYGN